MSRVWCACLLLAWSAGAVAVQVQASGAVARAGIHALNEPARLSDAALAAQPQPQAYMLGAAWLRPGLLESQQRLKAGVMFDLTILQQSASREDKRDLATVTTAMGRWIASLPVTGRQPGSLLDPRAVEANPAENHLLAAGDRLYYPLRPTTIRVVGAVEKPCTLPLVPLQDARVYLASCAGTKEADRDSIYVIEPDGRVFVQGIALWNWSAPQVLAPGALIYVPLRAQAIKALDPTFNNDVAAFLATQLLPPGVN